MVRTSHVDTCVNNMLTDQPLWFNFTATYRVLSLGLEYEP